MTRSLPLPSARATSALNVSDIHAQYADFVWRSLQRLGVRAADLEDALQEVFIVVHRRLATFDGSSRLSTWLFGICLRVASAEKRRAHVRREHATDLIDGLELENPRDPRVPSASPEQVLLESEAHARLERLLDRLDPEKRATVVMFEIEAMSAPEIARLMDVPVGTVYSRLAAARAELGAAAAREALREKHGATVKGQR